ncbi:hypothetical protein DdX_15296 [Ditylenchus destructor]|uniref:Uncharacterized protein n=1 Tax=Ditylenchus destructor TaxID=166010 RepID=A0AAD4R157_9BILA|nr:hypothetical protein DdX_15296 [Ditylenchus destructor]
MTTQFICSQCRMILDESERSSHISAQHLDYFPFECATCKKANKKHLETTEADMYEHISTCHNGNNLGIVLLKDQAKDAELNKMIEECICLSIPQTPPIDSKIELRRALNLIDSAETSTGYGNAAPNGPALIDVNDQNDNDDDVIIIEDDLEDVAILTEAQNGPGLTKVKQEINDHIAIEDDSESVVILTEAHAERIAKIEIEEPDEHSVANPIINFESNEVPGAVLPKSKPSVNISAVSEPNSFADLCEEMDFPNQSTSGRKRCVPDNVSNGSVEGAEKRRLVATENCTEYGGHSSQEGSRANGINLDGNYVNATVPGRNDRIERPTTSAQTTSSVPADSSQKLIITKLFIVISEGIVCFETIDHHVYNYAPLSDYLAIIHESILSTNGCVVVFQFYACDSGIPFKYRKTSEQPKQEFASLEQLKAFARQLHSIAFLWADVTVLAHFGSFIKTRNERLSHMDYCSELFGRERSILKCRKLDVEIVDNWPLSIATNVVDLCDECDLQLEEVSSGNRQLQDAFLSEIYDNEMLHKIAISFVIHIQASANDFVRKLKERFRRAPQKVRFQLELYSSSKDVHKLCVQIGNYILKAKEVKDANRLDLGCVIVEQGPISS